MGRAAKLADVAAHYAGKRLAGPGHHHGDAVGDGRLGGVHDRGGDVLVAQARYELGELFGRAHLSMPLRLLAGRTGHTARQTGVGPEHGA